MRDDADEINRKAREIVAQHKRERELAKWRHAPVDDPCAVEVSPLKWDPANPCGLTVKTMNHAQYNAWHAAGCPPLVTPVATVPKAKVDDLVRAAIAGERANTLASLETLASIIGEECGKNEKALRTEINALRTEISNLRDSDHHLRFQPGDAVLDLPNWRSDVEH